MTNILALIPFVISTVKAVEQMLPASSGKEKLEAAIATIENIYGALGESLPAISNFIAVVVQGLNAVGLFKKRSA